MQAGLLGKLFATEVSGSSQYAGKCLPQPLLNQKLNGEERLQFQVNLGIIIGSQNELHALPHQWKNGKIERLRLNPLNMYFKNNFDTGFSRGNKTPAYITLPRRLSLPTFGTDSKGVLGMVKPRKGWQANIGYCLNQVIDNGWHSDNWKLAEKLVQAGLSGCKCGLGYSGVLKKKSSLQYFRVGFWDFLFCLIH